MLLNGSKQEEDSMSPSLFNLVDLILQSADSSNPQTVIAALKLTTVLLSLYEKPTVLCVKSKEHFILLYRKLSRSACSWCRSVEGNNELDQGYLARASEERGDM